jgi:hypothetical protein
VSTIHWSSKESDQENNSGINESAFASDDSMQCDGEDEIKESRLSQPAIIKHKLTFGGGSTKKLGKESESPQPKCSSPTLRHSRTMKPNRKRLNSSDRSSDFSELKLG